MKGVTVFVICIPIVLSISDLEYQNVSALFEPAERQMLDFKMEHPFPIGLWTKSSGEPTEIRDIHSINSNQFNNQLLLDAMMTFDGERIPERLVNAKGIGAFGYFEVTHDVSEYTYADVFNGIGKKTPLVARLSTSVQNLGGSDVGREFRGLAVKLYTKQGNLDFVCFTTPVYTYRDPLLFGFLTHVFKRNPKTLLSDLTTLWDGTLLRPSTLHALFWLLSDYGIPDGYRKIDYFPIHAFEVANKHGEVHYVRFNFRTEQGFVPLTAEQAAQIQGRDLDYFNRDLYNNIEEKNYPAWRLEMDVMTKYAIQHVDFDPFDVTRLWKNGTFKTVQIGRVVLTRNADNQFRDAEQGAFNPSNLVPGIPGPVDWIFKGRRVFYRDAQNHRLGRNHNKILINRPLYANTYNRNGKPPTLFNGGDGPNYYPNSFNGPLPYVDEKRPKQKILTLESNAIDLEPCWYFYNYIIDNEDHRQRFISNFALFLSPVTPPVIDKVLHLLYLVDKDLGARVTRELDVVRAQIAATRAAAVATPKPPTTNLVTVQSDHKHYEF